MQNIDELAINQKSKEASVEEIYQRYMHASWVKVDKTMVIILLSQWLFAILLALIISPYIWSGSVRTIHIHVKIAIVFGGILNALPLYLVWRKPGWLGTRQVIAVAQMLWSGLLIYIMNGRIETHFHIFGSLAFLAFYRDWRIFPTATLVAAGDHLIGGMFWPESIYGITHPEWWQFFEHIAWLVFVDIILIFSCIKGSSEIHLMSCREAELGILNDQIEEKIIQRTAEFNADREQMQALVETSHAVPWEMNMKSGKFVYVGPQLAKIFDIQIEEWLNSDFFEHIYFEDKLAVQRVFDFAPGNLPDFELEYRLKSPSGDLRDVRNLVTISEVKPKEFVLRGLLFDVSEKKKLEVELIQTQKLESIGRLAAGVAHEINTPIQFVSDSVHFVKESIESVFSALGKIERQTLRGELEEEADWSYVAENVPKALERALDGLQRVAKIVRSMKEFVHPENESMIPQDLNRALSNTLNISRNEYKFVAEAEFYPGEIPLVICNISTLNQVFLNIVINASHAIEGMMAKCGKKGLIKVSTTRENEEVVISISDTGGGIPDEIKDSIFDQFFTTKVVGKGTGMGLSLARSIIMKHEGTLTFESVVGEGTTFFIRLPVYSSQEIATVLENNPV